MEENIRLFINYLVTEGQVSKTTLEGYERNLKRYVGYLNLNGINDFDKVREKDVKYYMECLKLQRYDDETRASIYTSISHYHQFLTFELKLAKSDPTVNLKRPSYSRKTPTVLTHAEIEWLLIQPDVRTSVGLRDRAILELVYATGMRISELTSLKLTDLNFTEKLVRCVTPKKKERWVPVGKYARVFTDRYLSDVRPLFINNNSADTVFLTQQGGEMSRKTAWALFKEYAEKARIQKSISLNTIRHTFAAHLLEGGMALDYVQLLLGHVTIETTEIYEIYNNMKIDLEYLRKVIHVFHPRG